MTPETPLWPPEGLRSPSSPRDSDMETSADSDRPSPDLDKPPCGLWPQAAETPRGPPGRTRSSPRVLDLEEAVDLFDEVDEDRLSPEVEPARLPAAERDRSRDDSAADSGCP